MTCARSATTARAIIYFGFRRERQSTARADSGTLFDKQAPAGRALGTRAGELQGTMIYIVNLDTPGFIGRLGTALGEAGINIATFNLGRREALGEAVALVAVDGDVPVEVVEKLSKLEGVREVVPLRF